MCPDWPNYFLANKDTIVINQCGQVSKVKDAKNDSSFRPTSCDNNASKVMKPVLTYGMSKDSPFHSGYTKNHPSTKQLLDYGEKRQSSNLEHVKHPKLFMTIMRQGVSKEMQQQVANHYNATLQAKVKRVGQSMRQIEKFRSASRVGGRCDYNDIKAVQSLSKFDAQIPNKPMPSFVQSSQHLNLENSSIPININTGSNHKSQSLIPKEEKRADTDLFSIEIPTEKKGSYSIEQVEDSDTEQLKTFEKKPEALGNVTAKRRSKSAARPTKKLSKERRDAQIKHEEYTFAQTSKNQEDDQPMQSRELILEYDPMYLTGRDNQQAQQTYPVSILKSTKVPWSGHTERRSDDDITGMRSSVRYGYDQGRHSNTARDYIPDPSQRFFEQNNNSSCEQLHKKTTIGSNLSTSRK